MNAISTVSTARTLAATFAAMRELGISDRHLFDDILRQTLAHNRQYLGVWTVWEPNALDGRDREFANKPKNEKRNRMILHYDTQDGARVVLTGINENKDSIYVVLDRTDRKYALSRSPLQAGKY